MSVTYANGKSTTSAGVKVVVSGLIGLGVGMLSGLLGSWTIAPLLGWEAAAIIFLGWTWATVLRLDDKLTGDFARREDPSRAVTDMTVLTASLASLVALGLVLMSSKQQSPASIGEIALGVLSVILSWLVVHTVFMLKYAELYYQNPSDGVEFEGTKKPTYTDFAYLAFTLGMTFQVSDTGLKSTEFRSAAIKHALLSYLFGTIIVATTVNLIAGLSQ